MPLADPLPADSAAPRRWLAIVGIGEDGAEGLSPVARRLVEGAEIVFGGKRHLALAGGLVRGALRHWPSPFEGAVGEVLACRGRQVCVLASGDPFHYGIGPLLAASVPAGERVALPAPSAFSLSAARLGWPLAEVVLLSLHGRPPDLLRPHLHDGARILALTSDGAAPAEIARLVAALGFGASHITVMEALGGARERITRAEAGDFPAAIVDPLNLLAIEVVAGAQARVIARVPGLADALFEHDGQITKREIRAVTLSALAPCPGELLWDIGAGSGSVGIEWLLADRSMRAIAVEANPVRAARAVRNAAAFGVPGLRLVEGAAPAALAGLPAPDAIFVGCGAGDGTLLPAAMAALREGGRLVVNAVTLETEAALLALHATHGGDLVRISISRAEPVGGKTGWRTAMPVTQWRWVRQ